MFIVILLIGIAIFDLMIPLDFKFNKLENDASELLVLYDVLKLVSSVDLSETMLMTAPIASEPYNAEQGPLIISIF